MLECQQVRFWKMALQTGLVPEDRLRACWEAIPPEKRTPEAADRRLAKRAIDAKLLTVWQAQQLLLGLRPQSLWYDKYVLLDLLGQGGMGRVFLARDGRLKRKVAIKVLSRERLNNPRAVARFRREAKVGAQLQHDNLVRIYDEGEVNGNLYLVMEYIEGKNVAQLLAQRGPLPPPIAARIARQIALGLEHAHQKGLVHRDVNPMNILIDRDGTAKLTDLGLAIDLEGAAEAVTREGATVGTFDYISPEQARNSRAVDIRSDVYSLGCTLYHMLSGRVPFPQPSLPEKLYSHQLVMPESLLDQVTGLPYELEAVVRRMMAKKPDERYARPLEAAVALAPFESGPVTLHEIEATPEQPLWLDPVASDERDVVREPEPEPASWSPSGDFPMALGPQVGSGEESFLASVLDMGPPPPLSDSSRNRGPLLSAQPNRPSKRLGVVAAAVAIVVMLLVVWFWGPKQSSATLPNRTTVLPGPTGPSVDLARKGSAEVDSEEEPVDAGLIPCRIRWLDDQSSSSRLGLQEAIRRAAGRRAEIRLEGTGPVEVPATLSLSISGGRTVIRPEGAGKILWVVKGKSDLPLFEVTPDGGLSLERLTIRLEDEAVSPPSAALRPLIVSYGDLRVVDCEVVAEKGTPSLVLASLQGRRSELENCTVRGLPRVVEMVALAGSEVRFVNCRIEAPARTEGALTCAISVVVSPVGQSRTQPRRFVADRCTIVAPGLLACEDVGPAMPFQVELSNSLVLAEALVQWTGGGEFPEGLTWTGSSNRYDVRSLAWVRRGSDGLVASADSPDSLATWSQGPVVEKGTKIVFRPDLRAADADPGQGVVAAMDEPGIGYDPARGAGADR